MNSTVEPVVPLSELERDLPAPPGGWAAELAGRGAEIVLDDLGRAAVDRATARALFAEHREQQQVADRRRAEIERRAIEAHQRFRASLPAGIPWSAEVPGLTPAMLMMAADPMGQGSRRESVLEHSLSNPAGALVFHPVNEDAS
jgi:hypothetical protein